MRNAEIKQKIYAAGLKIWQVAEVLGVHPNTLTLWLRYDLTNERREKIEDAIDELRAKKVNALRSQVFKSQDGGDQL